MTEQSKTEQELRRKIRALYMSLPRYDIDRGVAMIEEALPGLAKEAGYISIIIIII